MSNMLKDLVKNHVTDPSTQAVIFRAEMEPVAGIGTPIAPPTYASQNSSDKSPHFALSKEAFVPERGHDGWYNSIQRTSDGSPRLASRVTVDSVGSQSGRCETALWEQQERLGVVWPGIVVSAKSEESPNGASIADKELRESLNVVVSTWTASHRQVDAITKYAQTSSGKQVWEDETEGSVKDLIISASPQRAELLYKNFPNSCVYGYWLSSGSAIRHRLPRAYSSEIVGYGAHQITAGATKLDPFGGAPNDLPVEVQDGRLSVVTKGKSKPSDFGLGQIPRSPEVRGFACELILQQSSLSLGVLRSLRFPSPAQRDAALTVLTLVAMAGHLLAQEDGFLRSSCSLAMVDSQWGWRSAAAGRSITDMDVPTVDEVAHALREAIQDAAALGLDFEAPIELVFSEAQRQVIKKRVSKERTKAAAEEQG